MTDHNALRINAPRFLADFAELSAIGATGDGGVHRPSLSPADLAARDWLRAKMSAAGLAYSSDAAANQFGLLRCGAPDADLFILGSHLDSVPSGGRFDGALGVLAALEVLRTVQETGARLPFDLILANWTDEEGTLLGFLGSRAVTGLLSAEMLDAAKIGRAELAERLRSAGGSIDALLDAQIRLDPARLAGYLELHIEQGPRLEQAGRAIGVVIAITGITAYRLAYLGRADHSGTTPLAARRDAGLGAGAFLVAVREMLLKDFPNCVVNIGQISFSPGAFNIVPARADLALEFRSADPHQLPLLEMAILKTARAQADRYGLLLETHRLWTDEPAQSHPKMQAAIRAAAEKLGLSTLDLASGAGHDAQILGRVCPAGMIFVPSVDGASHAPRELTRDEDCVNGANVLLQAVLAYASRTD